MREATLAMILGVALASCAWLPVGPRPLPDDLPADAETLRVTLFCAVPFEADGRWWDFRAGGAREWPPAMPAGPFDPVVTPYEVPGSVVILSDTEAVFIADSNGSRFHLMSLPGPPEPMSACL